MLTKAVAENIICPVSTADLVQFVACLDPNQAPQIAGIATAVTSAVENYLGDFIVQRSIRWTLSRGESEKTEAFFNSWLSARSFISYGFQYVAGQWIDFPTAAQSVQNVTLGVWGQADIPLTLGPDYAVDLSTDPCRMSISYNLAMQDLVQNFSHLQVDYTGGIAPSGQCPTDIELAIKLMTADMFNNRSSSNGLFSEAAKQLLCNYRRYNFGSPR
ncbi:hypothetical protein [Novacetimonas hansenii]|uniref:Uncharacterized protein n=1 Tax=Novacetimonas hansenii TaxID=436 RepID=A0ABQ0SJL6_NOVHA|nr:hypothetical protein [Novacetimonas hansenii]GAN84042.1 hypothetical protein Gaha_0122_042 [Novacetimonas hansenii JCM 7643]GBQ55856.1 hypothetical protein AA0243_1030 [Novacetimonas hansenii NRIC 0243]GEC64622.1 hypothetical protein GHA01_24710 [Novacetimonas hansenii]